MTRIYPDIHYPHTITAIRRASQNLPAPPSSPVEPIAPQEPQPFPLKLNLGLGVATLIASIVSRSLLVFGIMALITLGVTVFCWLSYGNRRKKFEVAAQQYEIEQGLYQEELSKYGKVLAQYMADCRAIRQKEVVKILSTTKPPDGYGSDAQRGWSENKFFDVLNQYFSGKLYRGYKLQNPSYSEGYHYTADICYRDELLNLFIDIEIDEPYGYRSGNPIHGIDNNNEDERNQHFLRCGWFVVRFAEEQVVRYPQACCKTIAELIAEITGEPIPAYLAIINPLPPINRWTTEEAFEMWKQQYRNTYLN